ncbi:unnamed protein product [Urochloa humidicola]
MPWEFVPLVSRNGKSAKEQEGCRPPRVLPRNRKVAGRHGCRGLALPCAKTAWAAVNLL